METSSVLITIYSWIGVLNILALIRGYLNGTLGKFSIDTRGALISAVIASLIPVVNFALLYMFYSDATVKWWNKEI